MKHRIVTLPALVCCIALAVISAAIWAFMQSGLKNADGVNIYKDGKIIGDFVCNNSIELENTFNQLHFNWD